MPPTSFGTLVLPMYEQLVAEALAATFDAVMTLVLLARGLAVELCSSTEVDVIRSRRTMVAMAVGAEVGVEMLAEGVNSGRGSISRRRRRVPAVLEGVGVALAASTPLRSLRHGRQESAKLGPVRERERRMNSRD